MNMVTPPTPNLPQNYSTLDFTGLYRGKIIDNRDPERLCRLKVKVHHVYDQVRDEHLPWAEMCSANGGSYNHGFVTIPPIGADVWILFYGGDINYPVWLGTFYGMPSQLETPKPVIGDATDLIAQDAEVQEPSAWQPEYPHNHIFRTPNSKLTIELDDTLGQERIHIWHSVGTHIEMRANGDLIEHIKGNHKVIVDGNREELIKGNLTQTILMNNIQNITMNSTRTVGMDDTHLITMNQYNTITLDQTNLILGKRTTTVTLNEVEIFNATVTRTIALLESVYNLAGYEQYVTGHRSISVTGISTSTSIGDITMNITGSMTRNATIALADNAPVVSHN